MMTGKVSHKVKPELVSMVPEDIPEEITASDEKYFSEVISTDLTTEQKKHISSPDRTFPYQREVLAVHWHPEFIPFSLIKERIEVMYPKRANELIIPTQHNVLLEYGDLTGVEVDCYSRGFNQKVQLLLHFKSDRLANAGILKEMLSHTYKYRSGQLFEFINTIVKPDESRLNQAARETGVNDTLIRFVQIYVAKIQTMLEAHETSINPQMIRNKLLRNFFDQLRETYGDALIERAQTFLRAVKQVVKTGFSLEFFYRTSEIIEEARSLDAGIVIPHPEQFWPVLLADYDVDGYEVWNPQSHRYTDFLISVLRKKNSRIGLSRRRLLIFMGDDTHLGEKVKAPQYQNPEKAAREIGFQPAWDDLNVQKNLILADMDRGRVINEYRDRFLNN
jgi:hypothetical protein